VPNREGPSVPSPPVQASSSRRSISRRSHSVHFNTRISGHSPTRGIVATRVNGRPQIGQERRSFITYGACYRRLTFECGRKGLCSPRARRAGALYSMTSSTDPRALAAPRAYLTLTAPGTPFCDAARRSPCAGPPLHLGSVRYDCVGALPHRRAPAWSPYGRSKRRRWLFCAREATRSEHLIAAPVGLRSGDHPNEQSTSFDRLGIDVRT
jgi:hypothetical protein